MTTERFKSQNMKESDMMALDQAQAGSIVRIGRIDSGHRLDNRLAAMGLLKNTEMPALR